MNSKTKNIVLTGLMAAIIATLSVWQIPLPFGVPLTFQVFAVSLSGYVLGKWQGLLSTFIYIFLGGVGLPLFSGFQGGLSVIAGPGGGFIIGFLFLSFFSGLGRDKKHFVSLLFGILGLFVCHFTGIMYFSFSQNSSPVASFMMVSLPYIIKDLLLLAGAYFISFPVKKVVSGR